jgi:hypothetical protein
LNRVLLTLITPVDGLSEDAATLVGGERSIHGEAAAIGDGDSDGDPDKAADEAAIDGTIVA